jgi:hypothetical protein
MQARRGATHQPRNGVESRKRGIEPMTRERRRHAFEQQRTICIFLALRNCTRPDEDARKMAPTRGISEPAPEDGVRAVGLEPTTHGLKVRARPGFRSRPPMFSFHVLCVLPVLSPFPSTSVAGRLSACVRPSRAARGGCRHGCRQINGQQSVDLLGETTAVVVRLVATGVWLPMSCRRASSPAVSYLVYGVAVGYERLQP